MANGIYNYFLQELSLAAYSWTGATWKVQLCNASYTPNFTTDQTVSAFAGDTIGAAFTIPGAAVSSAGVWSADSVTVTGVGSGLTVKSIVVYYDNGAATFLAFYFDTGSGLPYSTTGASILINWATTPTHGVVLTL